MPTPNPPAQLLIVLQRFDPRVQRLMLRAREYVWRHFKPATERVFEVKYTGVVWYGGPGKMKERTVYTAGFKSHVNIGFLYGASLPDPHGILRGKGAQMRHVQIKTPEDLDSAPLAAVLKAARIALTAGLLWCVFGTPAVGQSAFPARLDSYFTSVLKLSAVERQTLLAGKPLAKLLDADPEKEVAVFGAVWIAAPASAYVAAVKDIENFEKGAGFRATKKISETVRLDDFAQLSLPDDDLRDLKSCQVGDCALKLSADALARLRKDVDWTKPDVRAQVEALFRRMAVEYVNAYRDGGNKELAVYRDNKNPVFVANEFQALVNAMPELAEYVPTMRQYLLDYPKPPARPTTSFLYWQEAQFGLKPTIRLSHVAIQESADATVVASKQLYSSHYFWTALELRVLVPDASRGSGFWFVNVTRSRSDGLAGFSGRMIRGKVREGARSGVESALVATKNKLEAAVPKAAKLDLVSK